MKLILIRLGETLWIKEGRIQGLSDVDLNDAGIEQARRLAFSLQDTTIGAVHASPLKRAYRTAEIINSFHGRRIEVHADLMEMDQGDFEGVPFKELMAREKDFLRRWVADPVSVRMPRGESLEELQKRAWRPIEKMIAAGEDSLVVAHNFTIAVILCRLRNISLNEFRSSCVDNASKTLIRVSDGQASIEVMNDRSHLEPSGI